MDAAHFTLAKVGEAAAPVSIGVFLAQRRMGACTVEITPATNLDVNSGYELRVAGTVKALDGTPMGADWTSSD